jgi:hypothetical protein
MKSAIVVMFLGLLCFQSCELKTEDENEITSETIHIFNPLDTILGDKVLNAEKEQFRYDNFSSLLFLEEKHLNLPSELYVIENLDSNTYRLKQKTSYSEARNFSMLISTHLGKIKQYHIFNDFLIGDIQKDKDYWLVLLSDYDQHNTFWRSNQQIHIVKMDFNFNEIWRYSINEETPFLGGKIRISNDKYYAIIEVITGCHMCYVEAELTLTKQGELLSIEQIGKVNSAWMDDEELRAIIENN